MYSFSHHKIQENGNGYDIYLYVNTEEEYSAELGTKNTAEEMDVKESAKGYIKQHFPNLKINAVKIMGGAILVSTLAFGPYKVSTAEASSNPSVAAQQATYTVKAGDTLSHIANANNTTVNELRRINNLTSDMIRVGQTLILPVTSVGQPVQTSTYTVVAGDTLSGIASRHGTTVNAIRQANNLTSDLIRIGQTLSIPGAGTSISAPTTQPTQTTTYTVVSGDTLSGIASRHGTTVHAIRQVNNLTSDLIRVGQTLTIVGASTLSTTQSTQSTTYIVVSGDTLSGIAARHGITVNAIRQANNLTSDFLRIGQALTIPTSTDRSSTGTQTQIVQQEELLWLARIIHSEARGETLLGQIAVGAVIMNRVKSNLFPNTVQDVIFQNTNGQFQFTPASNGTLQAATPNEVNFDAARRALQGEDPTNGALYFYNPSKTNDQWVRSRTVSITIENHVFAY